MSTVACVHTSRACMLATKAGKIATLVLALALALLSVSALHAKAQDGQSQQAHGLIAYLGVLPAAMVKGHDPSHVESAMHGGAGSAPHEYHLIVALFEAATGLRVTDAEVTATITGLGHVGGTRVTLEPMEIDDTITYGNFIDLPGADLYTIAVAVKREAVPQATIFEFTYDHRDR